MKQKRTSGSFQPSTQIPESKQKRKEYIREYRGKKRASGSFEPSTQSSKSKQKRKEYIREYREKSELVNVPADVMNTVSMLPRMPTETSTIKFNLKRKLQYNFSFVNQCKTTKGSSRC